jgi:hypothetical protein
MKVIATNKYKELGLEDALLHRIPMEGEELEITEERYKVLSGNNTFKAIFVRPLEDVLKEKATAEEVEVAKKEVKKETTAKKTTKRISKKKAE